jgi:hypothetical protein
MVPRPQIIPFVEWRPDRPGRSQWAVPVMRLRAGMMP